MRAQLLHLSGPLRGRTATHGAAKLEVGSRPGAMVRLQHPAVAERHAVIEWHEADCAFVLRRLDGQVFVNRNEIRQIILKDEDLIEWGVDGPRARFRAYAPSGAVCKPVRRMLVDARDVGQNSGRASAVRGLARDLLTQATPRVKIGVPAVFLLLMLPLAWFAGWLGGRPERAARRADQVTLAEVEQLRAQQREHAEELARLRSASAVMGDVQQRWSRGVCLVHGIITARWPDGRPAVGVDGRLQSTEYTGSGFLAAADGRVLTNRHVLTPWETVPGIQSALNRGAKAEFVALTATFPGRAPVPIPTDSIRRRQDDIDVALFRLTREQVEGVPVLPLYDGLPELPDQRAIVVGYPTGLAALLAKADPALVAELRDDRADMTSVIQRLAASDQIRPTITQGIVGNIEERMLVYDAPTTHGGSGGPVFGGNGVVIAVNYAILREFSGANFGVPIKFGRELLAR